VLGFKNEHGKLKKDVSKVEKDLSRN
jgi:chromosome segregation ATPase